MKFNKPKFWDDKVGLIAILLYPASLFVLLLIFLKRKIIKTKKLDISVICVGNIYLGGTGKTPTSLFLANELNKLGRKSVIIRKFYKNHIDEHRLIKENFTDLIVDKNRINGLKNAINNNFNTAILDDGLQDYKVKKNLSIVCFNENQLVGNGLIIPSGPLRESLGCLKNVDIILINGEKNKNFEEKLLNINKNLEFFYSYYKPINLEKFRNRKLLAIAGIGNPENFFKLIEENGLMIEKKLIYPDHYKFSKKEFKKIIDEAENKNYKIIMTEKDYYKIKDFKFDKIDYLKISLEVNKKEEFINKVNKLND